MGRDCTGTRIGILVLERAVCNDLRNGRTRVPAPGQPARACSSFKDCGTASRQKSSANCQGRPPELMFPVRAGLLAESHGPGHQIVDLDRCRLLSRRSQVRDSGPADAVGNTRVRSVTDTAAEVSCAGPVSMTMSRQSSTRRAACAACGVLPAELPVTPALPVEGNDILWPARGMALTWYAE